MRPQLADGWITVPYDGHDFAELHLAVGGTWAPAFRDTRDGHRVLKVRPPAGRGRVSVRLSVDGQVSDLGWIRL
jgi:hypothetical protein